MDTTQPSPTSDNGLRALMKMGADNEYAFVVDYFLTKPTKSAKSVQKLVSCTVPDAIKLVNSDKPERYYDPATNGLYAFDDVVQKAKDKTDKSKKTREFANTPEGKLQNTIKYLINLPTDILETLLSDKARKHILAANKNNKIKKDHKEKAEKVDKADTSSQALSDQQQIQDLLSKIKIK